MNVWLVFVLGGLVTFLMRFSFIFAFGKIAVPPSLHKALRFVPPAVLSAIVFPELFLVDGRVSLLNRQAFAGAAAILVAAFTRRALPTIAAGMAVLLALRWLS